MDPVTHIKCLVRDERASKRNGVVAREIKGKRGNYCVTDANRREYIFLKGTDRHGGSLWRSQ